jgi:hypothetical protein
MLRQQAYKNFEIVLVEQVDCTIGNQRSKSRFYKNAGADRYVSVINRINHKFNQPWMLNVGAKVATGDRFLFYDIDLVVRPNYLTELVKVNEPFFFAWNKCYHMPQGLTNFVQKNKTIPAKAVRVKEWYVPAANGHAGYAVAADRDFFINKLGCYNENLFDWGGNDNEIAARVTSLLRRKIGRVEEPIFHLWHTRSYAKSNAQNRNYVFTARRRPAEITKRLVHKVSYLGNPKNPMIIDFSDILVRKPRKK